MYNRTTSRRELLRRGFACSAGFLAASSSKQHKQKASASSHFPALNQMVNGKQLIYFDTAAINLVASSWGEANIGRADEVVLTIAEHASNMLPWQLLAKRKGARVHYVDVLEDGNLDLGSLKRLLTERTKLVCFSHVSNVLGIINPAAEICRLAHQVGAKVLIDAAQSVP